MRRMFVDIDADFYVMVDGDATYDPSAAPRMIRVLAEGRYDLVNAAQSAPFEVVVGLETGC
jgi:hypothetical protein